VSLGDAIGSGEQAAARIAEFLGIDSLAAAGQPPARSASGVGPD
jgi:hypothetical protein